MSTCIVCFKCGKISKTKEALHLHNYKVHGVGVVSCDQCGKTFTSAAKHKNHVHLAHSENSNCPDCHQSFKHISSLSRHVKQQHNKEKHNNFYANESKRQKIFFIRFIEFSSIIKLGFFIFFSKLS